MTDISWLIDRPEDVFYGHSLSRFCERALTVFHATLLFSLHSSMLASYSSPILAAVFKCGLAKPNYLFFFTFTSLVECFVSPSARILQDAFYFLGSSFHNKLQLTTSVLSVIEASMILKCHDFADAFQIVRSVYTPSLSQP